MRKTYNAFLGLFCLNLSCCYGMDEEMTQWENAAQMNSVDAIQTLLLQENIVSADDHRLTSSLLAATRSGNTQIVSVLLDYVTQLVEQSDTRWNVLMNAIESYDTERVQFELNEIGKTYYTDCRIYALNEAIFLENIDMIDEISRSLSFAPIRRDSLWSALNEASKKSNIHIVKEILSHLKQREVQTDYRIQVLNNALRTRNVEVMNAIASWLLYWSAPEDTIYRPFRTAVAQNLYGILKELLSNMAVFDKHAQGQLTHPVIFHDDFSSDNFETLNKFFTQRMQLKERMLKSAAQEAIMLGHISIAKKLLTAGLFDINTNDLDSNELYNEPLLMIAAGDTPSFEIVCELLNLGADPTLPNSRGVTALMNAATYGNLAIMNKLLSVATPLINQVDSYGQTALMFAAQNGQVEALRELLAQGANRDKGDNEGTTALMFAAQNGEANATAELITQGVSINQEDNRGRTALMYALNSVELLDNPFAPDTTDQRLNIMKILIPYVSTEKLQEIYDETLTDTSICKNMKDFLTNELHFKKYRLNFLSLIHSINHTTDTALHLERISLNKVCQISDLIRYINEFM